MYLQRPKPPCDNCNWRNPASQGTLVAETYGYPTELEDLTKYRSVYSDRLDYNNREDVSKLIDTGEQGWASNLRDSSFNSISFVGGYNAYNEEKPDTTDYLVTKNEYRDNRLREVAKLMFNLTELPAHVRVVYWFNAASGYDCPSFECII